MNGRAVPLWIKTSALSSFTLVFIAWWQIERARALATDAGTGAWVIAVGIPLIVPAAAVALGTAVIVHWKTRPLEAVFERIGQGDFSARLPPAPDRDFRWIEVRFDEMRDSLRELTEKLKRADSDRRRLFADLAHELATPTSSVLGVSEALQRPTLWQDEQSRTRMLVALDEEATRLERLVRDVRELATLDDPDSRMAPEIVDIGGVVERAVDRVAALTGRRVVCNSIPCIASVDRMRVDQIVMNLLTNAVRYTPADGKVAVDVTPGPTEIAIVVEDEGPGVSEEILPLLGERLFRVDSSRSRSTGGHGLGLSIVRAVVRRHGGSVAFERAKSGGLRVTIRLPIEKTS